MATLVYLFLSLIIGPIFIILPYLINLSFKKKHRDLPQKYESYESGIKPSNNELYKTGRIITISYYVLAMFFVVLDIDILFTFPLISVFRQFASSALIAIIIFTIPILIAIAYMYRNELFEDL